MLTPKQESYLNIIANATSESLDTFELAYSMINFRDVRNIATGRNVASASFHYRDTHFPPTPAVSEFQAGGGRDKHGERLSFTHIIRLAIESKWGSFSGITLSPNDIPTALTIEYLEQNPAILAALQQLDSMRVISERAFCYYKNDAVDPGCLPYFTRIDQMMGQKKVALFQTMGIQHEDTNKAELGRILPMLKANERIIDRKAQILRKKNKIRHDLQIAHEEFNQSIQAALEIKRKEYSAIPIENVEQGRVVMKQIQGIQAPPPTHIIHQLRADLSSLQAAEEEVNRELRTAFGLQAAPAMQQSTAAAPPPPPPPSTGGAKRQQPLDRSPAQHGPGTSGGTPSTYMSKGSGTLGEAALSNRKGLKNIKLDDFPPSARVFSLGQAVDDGGCFFDSIAQALNFQLKTSQHTEKSLRLKCHEYYIQHQEEVNAWNKQDYGGIDQGEGYMMVQYTKPEMDQHFYGQPPIWGRPNIEGKMLCRALNLEGILSIEMIKDPDTQKLAPGFRIITVNGERQIDEQEADRVIQEQRYPVLVGEQEALHFVPFLPNDSLQLRRQEPTATASAAAVAYSSTERAVDPLGGPLLSRLTGAQGKYTSGQEIWQDSSIGARFLIPVDEAEKNKASSHHFSEHITGTNS